MKRDKKAQTVNNNVRLYREIRSLSQKELGEAAGVDSYTIWNIENGKSSPRPSTRRKIANALEMPVEIVFPRSREQEEEPSPELEPSNAA